MWIASGETSAADFVFGGVQRIASLTLWRFIIHEEMHPCPSEPLFTKEHSPCARA